MAAHHQDLLARVVEHGGHHDGPHSEHVLREPGMTRGLHVRLADPNMRRVIDQPFTVDYPFVRVTHEPTQPSGL